MNENLETILSRAARSNLTPTAVEFVPRWSEANDPRVNSSVSDYRDNENALYKVRNVEERYERSNGFDQHERFNRRPEYRDQGVEYCDRKTDISGRKLDHYDKHEPNYGGRCDNRGNPVQLSESSSRCRNEPRTYHQRDSRSSVYYEHGWPNCEQYVSDVTYHESRFNHDRHYDQWDGKPTNFTNRKYNRSTPSSFRNLKSASFGRRSDEQEFETELNRNSKNDYAERRAKSSRDDYSKIRNNVIKNSKGESNSISYETNGDHFACSLAFENRFYKRNNVSSKDKSASRSYSSKSSKASCDNSILVGDDSICQRDRLTEQLNKGTFECLICCETVKQREPVWNCGNCYYVLHMWCVIKWARSSKNETTSWRCPACQNENLKIPEKYVCFCGKRKLQTEWNRADTAHSCGEVCGKSRENPTPWFVCEHRCTLLCHPGPCPPCVVQVCRECGCGRTQRNVQCSTKSEILCGAICDRLLNCGVHRCLKTCHFGECETCTSKIQVECFCGKKKTEVTCGVMVQKFSCNTTCERPLSCGNHSCSSVCHEGECGLCPRSPIVLNTCACGKSPLTENDRVSCLDAVSLCGQVCGKLLPCGPTNKRHTCESLCHEGGCGPCAKQTTVRCRCGALEKSIICVEINSKGVEFRCQKKCTKKRSCGKHKCNQMCCVDSEHICSQRCTGSLGCGKHRCELLCHRGKCGRCLQSSFEELYCHCGHSVIYPPVPCGTKPPQCDQPCRRQHDCDHPPTHPCHSDEQCPPCTAFTDKLCYGRHELRKTIPCYQKEFSCGLSCGAPLPCGFHKCQVPCHSGDCRTANKKCVQPCTKVRSLCGHPCNAPCHSDSCPETPCREMVKVTCACGNMVANHHCYEHADDYRRIVSATLAAKMSELQLDHSVNIGDISEKINARTINLRTLDCSDECKLIMRNRRLALALQIQNPDLSAKLTPRYSDFMKSWAKKDANLCRHIHDKLTALVKLAKESKQKSRSFSFEVMNKEKRQLVHEYCAHFGCESEAYDAEPKRNVVAIAVKGRCWLPAYSVLEVVQREMGQRKVPIPAINRKFGPRDQSGTCVPARIILPVLPSASSSHTGINYFGD